MDTLEIVDLTSPLPWHPTDISDDSPEITDQQYLSLVSKVEQDERNLNVKRSRKDNLDPVKFQEFFLFPSPEIMEQTMKNTTLYGSINKRVPMQQHYKSRNPILQRRRINEGYATDTWFSTVTSYEGYNCVQAFYGIDSKMMSHYGMQKESNGPQALQDF